MICLPVVSLLLQLTVLLLVSIVLFLSLIIHVGIDRNLFKTDASDFPIPELDSIGMQTQYRCELSAPLVGLCDFLVPMSIKLILWICLLLMVILLDIRN